MKKLLPVILILIILSMDEAYSCNTCGCGVANYHYGILPQFKKNFIGLRYKYRSYTSILDGSHTADLSNEFFQSSELWGRFYPFKRVQAYIFIPYNINHRKEGEKTTDLQGIGDVVVSVNYNLINTYDSMASSWKHNLLVGAGVKLPTGEFRRIEDGLTVNQNFQLGTGSVDLLLNLIYTIRHNNLGFNAEYTYNVNGTNKDEYRFGNTSRSGLSAFYIASINELTLMPNVGVSYETYEDNKQFGQPFKDTGGWASLYNIGLEGYYKSFAIGLTYSLPGAQELFSGQVTTHDRFSAHFTVMF